MNTIFVYGILKTGDAPVAYVRADIYDLGGFPACIRVGMDHSGWVRGEMLSVTDEELERFDRIEGTPTFYRRIRVDIYDDDKTTVLENGWIYEYVNATSLREDMRCGEQWTRRSTRG